jgi:hypothetical protein
LIRKGMNKKGGLKSAEDVKEEEVTGGMWAGEGEGKEERRGWRGSYAAS